MNRIAITLALALTVLAVPPSTALSKKKPAPRPVRVAPQMVLPPADDEQLAAAALVLSGDYVCEFGKALRVGPDPKFVGYADLMLDKQRFTLKPVLSQTGALRLEDVHGRLLMIQISAKSMVMDVKLGHRLVDDCVHEKQSENRRQMAAAPAVQGIGLGIAPGSEVAIAAANAASAPANAEISASSASAPEAALPPTPAASAASAASADSSALPASAPSAASPASAASSADTGS